MDEGKGGVETVSRSLGLELLGMEVSKASAIYLRREREGKETMI